MKMENQEKRKYSVPALETAFRILTLLSRKRFRESTLTEISNALSINPSTCFRVLHYLEETSMVRYDKNTKRFTLGPYLIVLGERAKEHLNYISIITPYLEEVTKRTGMTSVLVNRVGDNKLTFVAKVEGHDHGINVSIGRHFSITDGSYGQCFLAYMEQGEAIHHLNHSEGLRKYNPSDISSLVNEFEQIRRNGYTLTYGEYIAGICAIAAPIFIDDKRVEMCVAMIDLTAKFDREDLSEKGLQLKKIADEITVKIRGY
jgi:DNA-binding IclR family transcriptional regulator